MIIPNLKIITVDGIISTDDILPAHYKHKSTNPNVLSKHLFENKFPELANKIQKNTVVVGNATFGIGSSREQAVSALAASGVVAILSTDFGRIFFRNCWNLGLVAIETNTKILIEQESLTINLSENKILSSNQELSFKKLPDELIGIFKSGGLLSYVKNFI